MSLFHRHSPRRQKPKRVHEKGDWSRLWIWIVAVVVLGAGYFWLTTASIVEHPIELPTGPADVAFADSVGPLLGAEFSRGNDVQMLVNGVEFFPAMLKAVREAKKTITLETYIWESGKISDEFIAALNERAAAGVKVNVIVDGMGTLKFKNEDRDRLKKAGVKLLTYGREHWYDIKPDINHRTHRKLLIVDGKVGFTGGMCISDTWSGNGDDPDHWRETQVRIEGPVVREMQAVFATNWLQTTAEVLLGPDYFPETYAVGRAKAQCLKSGPQENPENARMSYLLAIAGARKSIRIEHAYFVPDDLSTRMLLLARDRGVKVQVIVPAKNDSHFGRMASRSRWGPLLAHGVEFYLFEPAMLHCKVMIVDDVFVTIGSVNFDNRSFSINDEVSANIIDADVARKNVAVFNHDLKNSRRLTQQEFENRSVWEKGADWFCGLFRSQL
ncbi:hypothetical protein K0B96_14195 [Horticoccus luteus]|uniref:PLD phosphodiesterase domain-containing protein n=1 Tax=Horticoccus luteus TaxID=2862869 RepID=A0A8F9TSV8_9BACT|nr:phospholipase D-like domain-containing protein [Horticoccus luteus]QYM78436.1 hypothetical protein K0B96_14195 [Horticoccus luteus]